MRAKILGRACVLALVIGTLARATRGLRCVPFCAVGTVRPVRRCAISCKRRVARRRGIIPSGRGVVARGRVIRGDKRGRREEESDDAYTLRICTGQCPSASEWSCGSPRTRRFSRRAERSSMTIRAPALGNVPPELGHCSLKVWAFPVGYPREG